MFCETIFIVSTSLNTSLSTKQMPSPSKAEVYSPDHCVLFMLLLVKHCTALLVMTAGFGFGYREVATLPQRRGHAINSIPSVY